MKNGIGLIMYGTGLGSIYMALLFAVAHITTESSYIGEVFVLTVTGILIGVAGAALVNEDKG